MKSVKWVKTGADLCAFACGLEHRHGFIRWLSRRKKVT
jgi:hypothetical protein